MNNFEFYNPVRIVFGKGEISALKGLVPKDKKVMLTYGGGSIKKNGVYDQVKEALQGVDVIEFGGIEPNPHYETLMKAIEIVQKEQSAFEMWQSLGAARNVKVYVAQLSIGRGFGVLT